MYLSHTSNYGSSSGSCSCKGIGKTMRNLSRTRRRSTKATENQKQLGAMSRSLNKSKLYQFNKRQYEKHTDQEELIKPTYDFSFLTPLSFHTQLPELLLFVTCILKKQSSCKCMYKGIPLALGKLQYKGAFQQKQFSFGIHTIHKLKSISNI